MTRDKLHKAAKKYTAESPSYLGRHEAFVAGADWYEKNNWISLDERKPEVDTEVLVIADYRKYGRKRYVQIANVHHTGDKEQKYGGPNSLTGSGTLTGLYFSVPAILSPGTVTHWQPLPSLP